MTLEEQRALDYLQTELSKGNGSKLVGNVDPRILYSLANQGYLELGKETLAGIMVTLLRY